MSIFRKKEKPLNDQQQVVAKKIAGKILKTQRRIADELNDRTSKFSARRWLVLFIAFSLLFGGYCLCLLLNAIYSFHIF